MSCSFKGSQDSKEARAETQHFQETIGKTQMKGGEARTSMWWWRWGVVGFRMDVEGDFICSEGRRQDPSLVPRPFGWTKPKDVSMFCTTIPQLRFIHWETFQFGLAAITLSMELKRLWIQMTGKLSQDPPGPRDVGQKRHFCPSKPGPSFSLKSYFLLQIELYYEAWKFQFLMCDNTNISVAAHKPIWSTQHRRIPSHVIQETLGTTQKFSNPCSPLQHCPCHLKYSWMENTWPPKKERTELNLCVSKAVSAR